nr:unnamed protein product [Digitaria exilis]
MSYAPHLRCLLFLLLLLLLLHAERMSNPRPWCGGEREGGSEEGDCGEPFGGEAQPRRAQKNQAITNKGPCPTSYTGELGQGSMVAQRRYATLAEESPLHLYDEMRLRQCMQNNSRLQQLSIPTLARFFCNKTASPLGKNKTTREDSEFEYDPLQDDIAEELIDDHAAKGSKAKTSKNTKKQTSGAVDGVRCFFLDDEGDAIARSDTHIHMANKDGFDPHDDESNMAAGADVITNPAGDNQRTDQAQLEREKMENAELLSIVNNQRKQLEEADQARIRMEEMSKRCADLEAKLFLVHVHI